MYSLDDALRETDPYKQAFAEVLHGEELEDMSGESTAPDPWPVLTDEALYGLAGDIVRAVDPYSEGDPVATLLNVLVAFGNCINATAHARVQHDKHPARLFVVQVGTTSKGRKGLSWSTPRYLFSLCDLDWTRGCLKGGLSSGEGIIYHLRDPLLKDEGVADKRLLVVEPEFASTLSVMNREGSTLSTVLRQAWDDGNLFTLTRNNPLTATAAHLSLIGHVTKDELLARLDDTSKVNGFGNRILWALVRRSKELPEGGAIPDEILYPLAERLGRVIAFSRTVSEVQRNEEARQMWREVYHDLSAERPGLLGAVISRAEAQVLRLSVIYALLDMSAEVGVSHLRAALAVWEHCERSAVLIFGQRLGDPTADRILDALRNAGRHGMSDNDIHELFGRNKSANERARALNLLIKFGLAKAEKEETGGRPRTVWRATR